MFIIRYFCDRFHDFVIDFIIQENLIGWINLVKIREKHLGLESKL